MYETILVPTDGSHASNRAVEQALKIAEAFDATVHALYVVDTTTYSSVDVPAERISDALEREGEQATDDVVRQCNDLGIDIVQAVEPGIPHQTILEYADDHDADLIVMGTHGRTGVERFLLGSITEKVVRTAQVPVLTVRMQEELEE